MATFYLDYEGGNDANDGTTFANRWKTITSGATAARIAPGDTIRIMGSPAQTSLGINGTWTNGPLPTTYAIVSSTNATPIVVTLSSANYTALAPAVGDTVIVNGHTTNTKANGVWEISAVNGSTTITLANADGTNSVGNGAGGATGTVRKANNLRVKLASALTANIAEFGNQGAKANWTASGGTVTCTKSTSDFKEGGECQSIAIAAGFATGMAAYFATGTLDLSGYKQVTFWIKQTAGTVGVSGDYTLRLCSDTVGAVPVDTLAIPPMAALNRWMPVTVDKGSALGAAIASVSFGVLVDRGAVTFLIDNIAAVKDSTSADSLSNTSLIGKNTGTETWWGIQSINSTRVMLDRDVNCIPTSAPQRGYSGTTETVTAYKRETIKLVPTAGTDMTVQDSGTSGSLIAFEGGWDRTAMTTQNLETWLDRQGGNVGGIACAQTFCSLNKLNMVRAQIAVSITGNNNTLLGTIAGNNNSNAGVLITGSGVSAADLVSVCGVTGLSLSGSNIVCDSLTSHSSQVGTVSIGGIGLVVTGAITGNNTGGAGVTFALGARATIGSVVAQNNATYGIDQAGTSGLSDGAVIYGGSTSGNTTRGVNITNGILCVRNFTISESTEVAGWTAFANGVLLSEKHDGTTDNHQQFHDGGLISSETSVRHTASGIAWRMQPTSDNRRLTYPLVLPLAKIAVAASALVTVKAWMRRDNTGLTMRLVCKGGQLSGVSSDVTASMTAAANTWEELTITFTPTEAGVIEVRAEAYGGTTYSGYVDDLTVTQA